MSIFQILATCFALFMLYVVNIHRSKAALSRVEVSFWYSTWLVFIFIAMFPHLVSGLTGILNFSRVFDFLVVLAMMMLTSLVFSSYLTQKENSKKLEILVRKMAIKDTDLEDR